MRLSTDSDLSLLLTPESYLFKIVQGQFLTKSNSTEKWRERCSTAILDTTFRPSTSTTKTIQQHSHDEDAKGHHGGGGLLRRRLHGLLRLPDHRDPSLDRIVVLIFLPPR
jgi:hypothetical protein